MDTDRRIGNLTGQWRSRYFYHKDDSSEHVLDVTVQGDLVIAQSLPQSDGSVVRLELKLQDDRTLTGIWQEKTSAAGAYAGRIFHGAIQLLLNDDYDEADGLWVGHDSRFESVGCGRWTLSKISDRGPLV